VSGFRQRGLAMRASGLVPLIAGLVWTAAWARQEGAAGEAGELAPVSVTASVDRPTATTGDLVTYRVVVEHDADLEVMIPEAAEQIGGLRRVRSGVEPARRKSLLGSLFGRDRRIEERWYELRADLVGSYELPPVEVAYRPLPADKPIAAEPGSSAEAAVETVASEPVAVEVESVLPEDGSASDIQDIKPLRPAASTFPWLWVGVGALVVALAVAAIRYFRRPRGESALGPPVPPHELAYRRLDELRGRALGDAEAIRQFYFELSGTLRTYVEARFGLNATDLTSEEILAALTSSRSSSALRSRLARGMRRGQEAHLQLEPEVDALLRRFLVETDRVKYADQHPARQEIDRTWEHARSFVEATEPSEADGSEESASAAGGSETAGDSGADRGASGDSGGERAA
jgi:hypothetical protein